MKSTNATEPHQQMPSASSPVPVMGRNRAFAGRAARVMVLVLGLVTIWNWQKGFLATDAKIDTNYQVTASTGINREQQFFFFLYHLGLFPVATDAPISADTRDEAERLFREAPEQLKQDEGSTFRSGDRGRTYLYFVDAWLRRDAITPSLRPAHFLAFVTALAGLFTAFWSVRRTFQGAVLVALLGSNPFQLFVAYKQENVFSWTITTMIATLALNVPLLYPNLRRSRAWYPWLAAAGSGLLVALVRNVRSEPAVILLGVAMLIATMTWVGRWRRLALVATLCASFFLGSVGTRQLIDHEFEKAAAAVERVGGSAFTGPRYFYHEFWHAVFCGLGDFDTKNGYEWNDRKAFAYVQPRLQKLHPEVKIPVFTWIDKTYDAAGKYPIYLGELSGYHDIVRDKILGDIKREPRWFLDIIKKRIGRIFDRTTPVGFAFKNESYYAGGRLLGWLCLPLLGLCIAARRWPYAKLILFSLPLSISPLLIYSDRGMTYYSTFHVFGAFVALALAADGARQWVRRRHLAAR